MLKIGDRFIHRNSKKWFDGTREATQVDVNLCVVTDIGKGFTNYDVLERLDCLDKAPFDRGPSEGGGLATRFIRRLVEQGTIILR